MVIIFKNEACKSHATGPNHPEQPARFDAVSNAIQEVNLLTENLKFGDFKPLEDKVILQVHTQEYISSVVSDVREGRETLRTGDTNICAKSWDIAKLHAGAGVQGVHAVFSRDSTKRAFCGMRPPGHHASADKGMGFCILNNVAIAARHAQAAYGAEKVMIVDWDVHHGNGTQDIFYEDESVFFFSTHQSPWYPGTGHKTETGSGKGQGTILNRPFPAGAGRKEILGAFEMELLKAANQFKPDLVIISAGFDSRIEDPLGHFQLTDEDFEDLTKVMIQIAEEHAEGRLLSMLEGGYNLDGLKKAVRAHVKTLADHS